MRCVCSSQGEQSQKPGVVAALVKMRDETNTLNIAKQMHFEYELVHFEFNLKTINSSSQIGNPPAFSSVYASKTIVILDAFIYHYYSEDFMR